MEARGLTDLPVRERSPAVDFTAVIVSHNTVDHLRECLRTLATETARSSFHVIVVDNASRDGSPEMVRREFPSVTLHANSVNVGYSRAVNQALRDAGGRYFLVLNPDILARPGSLQALVRFMDEHPRVGVAGGKLLNPDGTLQFSCRSFYTFRTLLYRRTFLGRLFPRSRVIRDHLMADWDHASNRAVDWVLGACMMVRRDAVQEVGLMDERFFLYFEDVDWCYRMKRRGWEVCYVADAVMVHHHRRESARGLSDPRFLNHLASVFHFYDKWNGALLALKRRRGPVRLLLLLASDLLAVNLAFFTAYLLRLILGAVLVKPLFPIATYRFFLFFVNATTLFSFFAFGLYQRRRGAGPGEEVLRIARAVFASFLILMAGTFLAQANLYSRSMVYAFWPIAGVYAAIGRLTLYRLHERLRTLQFDKRRAVLIGHGEEIAVIEKELAAHPELGYDVVLAVSDPDGLARLLRDEVVEEVIVAGSSLEAPSLSLMILECRRAGVVVTVMSEATELVALGGRLSVFGEKEALGFHAPSLQGAGEAARRALDVIVASAGLVLAVPPVALIAAVKRARARRRGIVTGGGGPLVRRLLAVGRRGKEFELPVFAVPRGGEGQPAGAARGDPSLYRIPFRYMTPALWNVLRGEMTLVGPRPRSRAESAPHGDWVFLLLEEKPGLTGPWRFVSPLADLDEVDRRYLRSRSLGLDLQMLIETLLGRAR